MSFKVFVFKLVAVYI